MRTITRTSVMNYWISQINSGRETYKTECGDNDYTYMGEDAARHFGISSENGQSEVEQDIFEWATELTF